MKRLALLAATALMTLVLAACGDNAEKKVDADVDHEAAQVQHNEAVKDVNDDVSDSVANAHPADEAHTDAAVTTEPAAVPADHQAE